MLKSAHRIVVTLAWAILLLLVAGATAMAQDQTPPDTSKKPDPSKQSASPDSKPVADALFNVQGEATFILQNVSKFHSPYSGGSSFLSRNEMELSDTYEMFLGARVAKNLEVYIDPEIAWGNGLSHGMGLGGYTNGDIIGQPDLRPYPFLAEYFVRWRVPMPHIGGAHPGGEHVKTEQTGRAPNIIAGDIPAHRLVIQAGKYAVSDVFDVNSYANNPREQFINTALNNNAAYSFAQETRGYDLGASIVWVNPTFDVRFGSFAMPTSAGGPDLAYNLNSDHGEQVELEIHPKLLPAPKPRLVVRLLGYRNVGDMGRYSNALAAQVSGMVPMLSAVRQPGIVKYGFGLNLEQALADGGDTGVFGRFGLSDGAIENYTNAEADQSLSFGGQLSGARWKRKDDRVGVAFVQNDISSSHQKYLAAGGIGLSLGDGALRYGSERIFETYYSYQAIKALSLSLDYQFISNPGYNQDRGPVSIVSLRAHVTF